MEYAGVVPDDHVTDLPFVGLADALLGTPREYFVGDKYTALHTYKYIRLHICVKPSVDSRPW
jgi:hypothetical protein